MLTVGHGLENVSGYPPYIPNPIHMFILHGGWYELPRSITGIRVASSDELAELVKNAELESEERFTGKIKVDRFPELRQPHAGIFPKLFQYLDEDELVWGRGYAAISGQLELSSGHHRYFKIGYQCEQCRTISSGVPILEVTKKNTLKGSCAYDKCQAEMFQRSLDYERYHPMSRHIG